MWLKKEGVIFGPDPIHQIHRFDRFHVLIPGPQARVFDWWMVDGLLSTVHPGPRVLGLWCQVR